MKKKNFINLLIFSMLSICSCNIDNNNSDGYFDMLGGANSASDNIETGSDASYSLPSDITNINSDMSESTEQETYQIDLSNLLTSNDKYTYENNVLTIIKEGIYELTNTLNGAIEVSGSIGNTKIILNNVNIQPTSNQSCAALTFKKNSSSRVLTIKDNSINTLKDSSYDDEDSENAVISVKKSSLTINGKGTLNLIGSKSDTSGIKVKESLQIDDVTINIESVKNGIKSDYGIVLKNTNINIDCSNDGIKTDIEASSQEEANSFTKDPYNGYIYINNSSIKINSVDDGICANSYLYIENRDSDIIEIVTNSGAPSTISDRSSDNASGKAIKTGGIKSVINDVETDLLSQCEDNYMLFIKGGTFKLNSNDDALTSKGNLVIAGGNFEIASGDDGIHAEYLTKITYADINITKSYEGIEGAVVEIYDGNITVNSFDDGINAANSDLKNYPFNIYFGGGNVTINASGDGIDSNGTIDISGGKIIVYGPTANDDGSLDADNGILVKGGILFAFGSSGMVETPASNSTQACIVYNANNKISANSKFALKDENDNVLYELTPVKQYQSVVISTPELVNGKTFKIITGSYEKSITISGIINSIGKTFNPGPGGGFGNNNWPR